MGSILNLVVGCVCLVYSSFNLTQSSIQYQYTLSYSDIVWYGYRPSMQTISDKQLSPESMSFPY